MRKGTVDAIIFKEKEPLVYYLNRQSKTTLILLSNKIEDATSLPSRALSTLQPKLLTLEPYTPEEAKVILSQRVEKAFQPGVISDEPLDIVAEAASKAEDIRLGFAILLSAGLEAEEAGDPIIGADDTTFAMKSDMRLGQLRELESIKKQLEGLRKKWRR